MKIDKAIKQESIYLLIGVVILSAIMEAVFLICGAFDYTVILGNILGGGIAVFNFVCSEAGRFLNEFLYASMLSSVFSILPIPDIFQCLYSSQ